MTTRYQITNRASGLDLGIYEGATEAEALDALARDAGYDDYAAACEVSGMADLDVTELRGRGRPALSDEPTERVTVRLPASTVAALAATGDRSGTIREALSDRVFRGYVATSTGTILVQRPADNRWGFEVCDDDQAWPGGFGVGEWTALADNDPRITEEDRERLAWLLE